MPVNTSTVRSYSKYYEEMAAKWELLYDLLGGTKHMRDKGELWLPREPKESHAAYESRLKKTFLFNAYKRTIKSLVGSAFIKPVNITNLPPELEYMRNDADGGGRSITAVAALLCEQILITGKANPYVDFPVTNGEVTYAQLSKGEIRPYINPIDPRDLIAWRTEYNGGLEKITEVRFVERTLEHAGEWSDIEVERVRVVRENEYLVYVLDANNQSGETPEYIIEESGPNTLGYIPIVPIYESKISTFVADPPLEDLAWLNLRHWQSSSDQNNILHVVRVPMQLWSGFDKDALEGLEIGANRAVVTSNENAKAAYIEHTGQAINAGKTDLEDLEGRMSKMGSDILSLKSVSRQTAAARQIDKAESMSTFQVILRNLEEGLEKLIHISGEWIGVDTSKVKVTIGDDLTLPSGESNTIENLEKLKESGTLTEEEHIQELKRRGTLAPHIGE